MGNRFNTAAGIARQFSAEHVKDLSRHTVSRCLREFGLKAHSAVTKPLISRKNQKARLRNMLCGQRRSGAKFTSVMKASLIYLGLMGNIMFVVKLRKDWTQSAWKVEGEVSWLGGCLQFQFLQQELGLLYSYMAYRVNANVYQNLLQQHAVPSLQASPNQPAIFMQDSAPRHTAKWIKQFLEAENIEIMKWPAQSPDLNLIENLWKIIGDKVMAKKPTTVTKLWKRLEEKWTRMQREKLVMSCCADEPKSLHFLLIFDCCNLQKF